MCKIYLTLAITVSAFSIYSCTEKPIEEVAVRIYYQNFKTDVAWIVLERNGHPQGYGSGFLIDKDSGAFYTNKHVSNLFDALGRGSHKIFFNGKVYDAEIVKSEILADASLVRIKGIFDSTDFPDPAPFSKIPVQIDDELLVEGFHPHPYSIRESDIEEGFKFPVIPIYKDYYNLGTRHLEKEQEVVFESLKSKVILVDKTTKIEGQGSGFMQNLRGIVNLHIEIQTIKDHKFPFGGLSGTVVRNIKGETVGIFTASPEEEYVPVEEINEKLSVLERVFKTALLTPIGAVNLR